jgi:hypothetical protein
VGAKPVDTTPHANPAERLAPGDGVAPAVRRQRQRIGGLRSAADHAVHAFLEVDRRTIHEPSVAATFPRTPRAPQSERPDPLSGSSRQRSRQRAEISRDGIATGASCSSSPSSPRAASPVVPAVAEQPPDAKRQRLGRDTRRPALSAGSTPQRPRGQSHHLGKTTPSPPRLLVCCTRHRSHLSSSVHEIGSSPRRRPLLATRCARPPSPRRRHRATDSPS